MCHYAFDGGSCALEAEYYIEVGKRMHLISVINPWWVSFVDEFNYVVVLVTVYLISVTMP